MQEFPLANPCIIDIRGVLLFFQVFYIDLPNQPMPQFLVGDPHPPDSRKRPREEPEAPPRPPRKRNRSRKTEDGDQMADTAIGNGGNLSLTAAEELDYDKEDTAADQMDGYQDDDDDDE